MAFEVRLDEAVCTSERLRGELEEARRRTVRLQARGADVDARRRAARDAESAADAEYAAAESIRLQLTQRLASLERERDDALASCAELRGAIERAEHRVDEAPPGRSARSSVEAQVRALKTELARRRATVGSVAELKARAAAARRAAAELRAAAQRQRK